MTSRLVSPRTSAISMAVLWAAGLLFCVACSHRGDGSAAKNSLHQNTGEAGSTIPRANPPYYPNTSGNIVAPPGNPGGNPAGAPPLVGGNMNQESGWPAGR